ALAPTPIIVDLTSGLSVGLYDRCWRASSATVKYCASSPISPIRFQVLPEREIRHSRVTTPATIHCCSVASSRQLFWSPFSRRIIHWRSAFGPEPVSLTASTGSARCERSLPLAGTGRLESGRGGGSPPAGMPTLGVVSLRI